MTEYEACVAVLTDYMDHFCELSDELLEEHCEARRNDASDAEITHICHMRREVGIEMNLLDTILDVLGSKVRENMIGREK